jgi:urease accessory protein
MSGEGALAGSVDLAFAVRGGRHVARRLRRGGNARVSPRLPNADGAAYHLLVSTGGGYLEGERYRVRATLEPGAHAVLATQAPTYVYKCPGGRPAVQHVEARLGPGAFLELYSDEVIPYRDARFAQLTEVELAPGAALVLTEGLSCGWAPDGGRFRFAEAMLRTRVVRGGELVLNDCLHCAPPRFDPEALGFFEGYAVYLSCVVVDDALDAGFVGRARARLAEKGLGARVRWGVSALEGGAAVLRVLCDEAQLGRRALRDFAACFREQVKGCRPLDLRKNDQPAG